MNSSSESLASVDHRRVEIKFWSATLSGVFMPELKTGTEHYFKGKLDEIRLMRYRFSLR